MLPFKTVSGVWESPKDFKVVDGSLIAQYLWCNCGKRLGRLASVKRAGHLFCDFRHR